MPFKPDGYTSVSPYLIVKDAAGTLAFVRDVFGAQPLRQFKDGAGRYVHAEVRIDDTVLMFADSAPEWPAIEQHVHVYVKDVDATYKRALAAGGTTVQAPVQKDDADKRGGVKDQSGTTWWLSTQQP